MRARFFDPLAGRFVSEDSACDGTDWFSYCWSDPVNSADPSGNFHTDGDFATNWYDFFMSAGLVLMAAAVGAAVAKVWVVTAALLELAAMAFVGALGCTDIATNSTIKVDAIEFFVFGMGGALLGAIAKGMVSAETAGSLETIAIASLAAYSTMLVAGLFDCYEGEGPDSGS